MSTPTPEDSTRSGAVSDQAAAAQLGAIEGAVAVDDLLDFELVERLTRPQINPRLRAGLACS